MNHIKIGLDRIVLYGFSHDDIDWEHLTALAVELGNIEMHESYTDGGWYIKIKDNHVFSDLTLGRRIHLNQTIEYAYLSLTPTNAYGHNLDNMSWSEYDAYLDKVLEYIETQYHICLGTADVKLKEVEINCNIPLDHDYADYDRPIRLLMSLLPRHLKCSHEYTSKSDSGNPATTYLVNNKSMGIKIYNKTAQMRSKTSVAQGSDEEPNEIPDIMRLEMSMDTPDKIKTALGTNRWNDLNDNIITDYYRRYIIDTLQKKYEQWCHKRRNELVRLIRTMRREHSKNWHHLTMQHVRNKSEAEGIPYILDIEQVADAYKQLPDKHRNRSRAINALMEIRIDNDLYHRRDCDKAQEILDRLTGSGQPSI